MARRQITPTARTQLEWIGQTYGIADQIDQWCRKIVAGADRKDRPVTELGLEDVLDELTELASTTRSDWELTVRRFREAGWLGRLNAIRALVMKRTPPNKIRVNTRSFMCLGDKVQVGVRTVYEIDLAGGTVTFLAFESFRADGDDTAGPPDRVQNW